MNTRGERCILQITAHPFPPEIRVVKEGLSLQKAGFSSAVLCPPIVGKPEREQWRGIQIFRPRSLESARRIPDKFLMQTCFFSYAWYRAIRETIALCKPDILHVHDIWLGRTAFWAKSDQHVVLDLHENMPAAVTEYLKSYRGLVKWFNAVFRNRVRVLCYERALLKKSDRVLAVVEEARNRILQNHPGMQGDKVVNVENLESKEFVAEKTPVESVISKDHFSILYIGGFGPHRGIETLIRAMVLIKRWGLNVRVHLVGARDCHYLNMLKDLIRHLDVSEHIVIKGWVPADLVLAYIRQADVGTVPHHSNPHTDNTIPHKLYQYMIAGTPVLVSTSPPLARTVQQANAGRVFKAGDDVDCAEKIREMLHDSGALREYAANGYRYVVQQGHNWEEESAPTLIETYDAVLGIRRLSGPK